MLEVLYDAFEHARLVANTIVDHLPFAARGEHASILHYVQVLRRIR